MEKENKNMKYKVCVDDNFHYQDESERFTHGEYETAEQAIQIAKEITDESLKFLYKKGMSSEDLYQQYTMMGDDPFIISDDRDCRFSAWNYAKERCDEICRQ